MQMYGPEFQYIAHSTGSTEMVSIEYINVQRVGVKNKLWVLICKDAPQYQGVDQCVLLNFQTLGVMCTPETVVTLYNMVSFVFSEEEKQSK
jgi:hypothetical protein